MWTNLLRQTVAGCLLTRHRCKTASAEPVFFQDLNFGGNVNDYYDPDNSYLNAVLRKRRAVSIRAGGAVAQPPAWAEHAASVSRALHGQGQPAQGQVVIDPFNGQS
jgi:hypothetical protein